MQFPVRQEWAGSSEHAGDSNAAAVSATLRIKAYGQDDRLVDFDGPSTDLAPPTGPLFGVLYRQHPWFGRRVCIHGAVDKDGFVVFRGSPEESLANRALEVPAWMFDRTACPDPGLLAAQPYVSIEALAALSALLDLALKDQTPSAALLSGASRASHDQNRVCTANTTLLGGACLGGASFFAQQV